MAISSRQFGEIAPYKPGSLFKNRAHLSKARVHRPTMAGISGSKNEGADSIVLNGGYIDDEDRWNLVLYMGHGGQDIQGRQIRNQ